MVTALHTQRFYYSHRLHPSITPTASIISLFLGILY
ncbi:hypothetical protein Lser_V15G24709 [Lactuca serriola]